MEMTIGNATPMSSLLKCLFSFQSSTSQPKKHIFYQRKSESNGPVLLTVIILIYNETKGRALRVLVPIPIRTPATKANQCVALDADDSAAKG